MLCVQSTLSASCHDTVRSLHALTGTNFVFDLERIDCQPPNIASSIVSYILHVISIPVGPSVLASIFNTEQDMYNS